MMQLDGPSVTLLVQVPASTVPQHQHVGSLVYVQASR